MNPFKFGTIVEGNFFTDRTKELAYIRQLMDSENHLVLISPRRFGKTSLVHKAVGDLGRPHISINLQRVVSTADLAACLLKEVLKQHPWERIRYEMSHFRVIPTISTNPLTDGVEVSFQPTTDAMVALEDAFALLQKLSTEDNRMIVVLDEFQEIAGLEKGIDKRLRAIMQELQHINFIILGSQESMMTEIFERKRSPFYHFGTLMRLPKIPYNDFRTYVADRLPLVADLDRGAVADCILQFTACHPYYTQQLSSQVWDLLTYQLPERTASTPPDAAISPQPVAIVDEAVEQIVQIHDLDFERIWLNFGNTDKRIIRALSQGQRLSADRSLPTSTIYSAIKRLMRTGYVIKLEDYELEDPFFRRWVRQ